jgi:hypothetical protein
MRERARRTAGKREQTIKNGTKGPEAIGKRPVVNGVPILVGRYSIKTGLKGQRVSVGVGRCQGETVEL